jgi:hypothetical protein
MRSIGSDTPDWMPILSRGKHRSPRSGACFMELASYLAGERWSDHPRCTHPLLAELARAVNDCTTDPQRSKLAGLIPSVIGLTSQDVRVDARIALHSARVALPVVSAQRQGVLAVSVFAAERVLAELDGRPAGSLQQQSVRVLQQVPQATRWADRFIQEAGLSPRGFRRHAAPATIECAVRGIAEACIPDPDTLLRQLLTDAIRETTAWCAESARRRSSSSGDRRLSPSSHSRAVDRRAAGSLPRQARDVSPSQEPDKSPQA